MKYKQAILIRKDLKMNTGKIVSQGAHASLLAYKSASIQARKAWESSGNKKVVLKTDSLEQLLEIYNRAGRLPRALIRDAGLTQVPSGEITAACIGPAPETEIDKLTGKLKLL